MTLSTGVKAENSRIFANNEAALAAHPSTFATAAGRPFARPSLLHVLHDHGERRHSALCRWCSPPAQRKPAQAHRYYSILPHACFNLPRRPQLLHNRSVTQRIHRHLGRVVELHAMHRSRKVVTSSPSNVKGSGWSVLLQAADVPGGNVPRSIDVAIVNRTSSAADFPFVTWSLAQHIADADRLKASAIFVVSLWGKSFRLFVILAWICPARG
jgi:hypothetical protein